MVGITLFWSLYCVPQKCLYFVMMSYFSVYSDGLDLFILNGGDHVCKHYILNLKPFLIFITEQMSFFLVSLNGLF